MNIEKPINVRVDDRKKAIILDADTSYLGVIGNCLESLNIQVIERFKPLLISLPGVIGCRYCLKLYLWM